MRLKDKVALVTGAGGGIGVEICRAFAAQGAAVAVTDIRLEAVEKIASEIRQTQTDAAAWPVDVCDARQVEQLADQVQDKLGPIDIWVNNAGVSYISSFTECSRELWDKTLAINLTGTFIGCQAAVRRMIPRRQGSIINMSSQSGRVGNSHYAAYCASKFGIIGLTQSIAAEFADHGIRANAICPGVVFTGMWEDMLEDYAVKRKIQPGQVKPYLQSKIPMDRLGDVQDVAQTAVFLAGDESGYINGQALNVTGGAVMS